MTRFDYNRPLNVGNQIAENDWPLLRNNFIRIGTDQFVGQSSPSIILGRKGSGKSALRLHFEKTVLPNQRAFSVQPSADDLQGTFAHIIDKESGSFSVEFISRLWELTVLLNLSRVMILDDKSPFSRENFIGLPDELIDEMKNNQRFGIGRTLGLIRKHFDTDESRGRLARVLRDYVKIILSSNEVSYFVLIDSIDDIIHNSLDTTKRNDLFATFFEGLLSFFRNFVNLERNSIASRIHINIFIPIDIFNWSVNRHADHVRQYKHIVSWNTAQLDDFITSRLLSNLPNMHQIRIRQIKDPQQRVLEIWNSFFPLKLSHYAYTATGISQFDVPSRNVLIGMTLRRPRDLQEIVRLIAEITQESALRFPTEEVINQALDRYSVELRQSVEKEFDVVFPEMSDILAQLAGNTPHIARNVLIDLVGKIVGHSERNIYKALHILYEACIIGSVKDKYSDNNSVVFYYNFQNFRALWNNGDFAVHQAFWHSVQLSPLRSKRV